MAAIDRTNIGYAQLQLGRDLGFSNLIYGTGASLFSLACFLFEVPGNLLLERIGARKSIGRIMILWGIASAGTLFVQSPGQFYFARFLLGCFEAGFAPGVFLYITYWYPQDRRARAAGYILSAIVTAGIIGGPISGLILVGLNGAWGLRGWQWMFLIEGLPATLLGIVAWFYLDDRPSQARWLSEAEKAAIAAEVKSVGRVRGKLGEVMRDPRVWTLGLMYLAVLGAGIEPEVIVG